MVTTVHKRPRGPLTHLSTWLQAIALVYAAGLAMVVLGAAVALIIRSGIELVLWIAGLM
jgi:hypothetical protein